MHLCDVSPGTSPTVESDDHSMSAIAQGPQKKTAAVHCCLVPKHVKEARLCHFRILEPSAIPRTAFRQSSARWFDRGWVSTRSTPLAESKATSLLASLPHVVLCLPISLRPSPIRWTEASVQKVKGLKGSMAQMASEVFEEPARMPRLKYA